MTTITNPALLSYKIGTIKYGLFKKVPFLIAYWKDNVTFSNDFINLIQLSANRMDFASTNMTARDRKDAFVYFSVYRHDDNVYHVTMNPNYIDENAFVCYVVYRAKDLGTISKYSHLLIGDMHKIDMESIYTLPVKAYNEAKTITSATSAGEFWVAYESLKTNLITALVNYQDMFE